MFEPKPAPPKPAFVSMLMNAAKQKEAKEAAAYSTFLEDAQQSHRALSSSRFIAIDTTGSVEGKFKEETGNRSLETIFYFYAKVQTPAAQLGVHAPTMDEIMWANNTLSFYELCIFCRDFNIIPTLLSKDELRLIWRVTSPQWVEGDLRSLRFCDFSDMLVRMALVAYNKSLMRKLLIKQYGSMPSPSDLVVALCNYLRLDDFAWVKHHIQTVGKDTMMQLNSRSAGEVDPNVKQNLRNEIAGKRLSKFMAQSRSLTGGANPADRAGSPRNKSPHRIPANRQGYAGQTLNIMSNSRYSMGLGNDDDDDDDHSLLQTTSKRHMSVSQVNVQHHVEKVSSKLQMKAASEGSTTGGRQGGHGHHGHHHGHGHGHHHSHHHHHHHHQGHKHGHGHGHEHEHEASGGRTDPASEDNLDEHDRIRSTKSILDSIFKDVAVKARELNDDVRADAGAGLMDFGDDVRDREHALADSATCSIDGSSNSSDSGGLEARFGGAFGRDSLINEEQENALVHIHPTLKYILSPFTQIKGSEAVEAASRNKAADKIYSESDDHPDYIRSGSGFLDFGTIPTHSKCVVTLHVTNRCNHELLFDVVARGFENQDAVIKVLGTPIAPGLQRAVKLHLTPSVRSEDGNHNILGYVDVYFKSTKEYLTAGAAHQLSSLTQVRTGGDPRVRTAPSASARATPSSGHRSARSERGTEVGPDGMGCITCPIFYRLAHTAATPITLHGNPHGTNTTTTITTKKENRVVLPRLTVQNMPRMLKSFHRVTGEC